MARILGIAGIQMEVAWGVDNSDAMLVNLNRVALLFPWVDIVVSGEAEAFFPELCQTLLDSRGAIDAATLKNQMVLINEMERNDGKLISLTEEPFEGTTIYKKVKFVKAPKGQGTTIGELQ